LDSLLGLTARGCAPAGNVRLGNVGLACNGMGTGLDPQTF